LAPVAPIVVGEHDDSTLAGGDQTVPGASDAEQHRPLRRSYEQRWT
jgi:hypothetical protein